MCGGGHAKTASNRPVPGKLTYIAFSGDLDLFETRRVAQGEIRPEDIDHHDFSGRHLVRAMRRDQCAASAALHDLRSRPLVPRPNQAE